jgi:hypothetical protein
MFLIAGPINHRCNFQRGAFILNGSNYKSCVRLAQLPVARHQAMVEILDRVIVELCREPIGDQRILLEMHVFAKSKLRFEREWETQLRSLYTRLDSALEAKLATHAVACPNALRVDSPMTGLAGYARTGPESLSFPECITSW